MKRNHPRPVFTSARQRGVTLIVAVVLLLLLSVIVLLATNVGLQEQRVSGNDFRAKMAHYAAEAGLNFGGEFFKQNVDDLRDPALWTVCPNDGSFPCGVFPNGGTLMRYTGDVPLAGPLAGGILAIGNSGFSANIRVGAVMCRLPEGAPAGTPCSTDPAAAGASVVSIVSRAQIAGEASSATLVQSITSFSKLNSVVGTPPIMSSGSVDVTGSLDVVTNPNSAGTGVPVSIWTRRDVEKTGSPNTCYLDEFIRFGAKSNAPATFCGPSDGCANLRTDIVLCDDCSCPADQNSLSFTKAGNTCGEGIDILDVDPPGDDCGPNENVVLAEFPCDLFQFVFGVAARTDEDGDFFCETLIKLPDPDNAGQTVGADELWLRQNANVIVVASPDTSRDSRERGCASIDSNSRGLVWMRTDCNLGRQVGSPERPLVLVVDGPAQFSAGLRLFGLLFVRALGLENAGVNTISANPTAGNLGGNASLRFNGRGAIYGAAVTQGPVVKANGTAAFIYNEGVLRQLSTSPELQAFGTLPGAWTDRFSY